VRRLRGTFRRRRRFLPEGRAPGGRKKHWVTRFYSELNGPPGFANQFTDLFELVQQTDYGDAGSTAAEVNHATVVRTVGMLQVDVQMGAPGANGVLWSAAIFVRSRTSVFLEFAGDGGNIAQADLFRIHHNAAFPVSGSPQLNLQRLHPMAWMPERAWSAAFRPNATPASCSDFFADVNRPQQFEPWYFDVKQRRKMKSDDSLWLLVSGSYVCEQPVEESPVFNTVLARTLLYDD